MKLLIGLATRGRSGTLIETVRRTMDNVVNPDTRLVIMADADDEPTAAAAFMDSRVTVDVRERESSVGAKHNRCMGLEWDAYLTMVDYAPHVTPGFDQKILDAAVLFPDNIGVVYNHMANWSFPMMNVITRGLADKMGYIYPEYFPYWFIDHWLDDIARIINRIVVADVICEVKVKPNTQGHREPGFWGAVYSALVLERRDLARKIIDSADFIEPEWRKEALRRGHTLIEERSAMINNSLQTMGALETGPDARYEKIKQATMAHVRSWLPRLEAEGMV